MSTSLCNTKKRKTATASLTIPVLLGLYFTMLQMMEYNKTSFTIADSIYGSTFFIMTGFHGIHVMTGTLFLTINLLRTMKSHISSNHHVWFEMAVWYWHFMDVVWINLYISIYWWGSL